MRRLLIIWTASFLGALGAQGVPLAISNIPLGVIPGLLMFAALFAFVPATMVLVGFACGHLVLRRRAMPALLVALAIVAGAMGVWAPDLRTTWATNHDTLLSWMPLLGGLAISCVGSRVGSEDARLPARCSAESTRRRLAIAEGAVLVFPLLVLWPFALVAFAVENHAQIPTLVFGLALLGIAAIALLSLLRLLKIFFDAGGVGLRRAPRSLWIFTMAGAGVVVASTLSRAFGVHTVPIGIGVPGVPALAPALHMLAELRSSKGGANLAIS